MRKVTIQLSHSLISRASSFLHRIHPQYTPLIIAIAAFFLSPPSHASLTQEKITLKIENEPVEAWIVRENGVPPKANWQSLVAPKYPSPGRPVPDLAATNKVRVAVNANFYREDKPDEQIPISLTVHEGKMIAPPVKHFPTAGIIDGKLEWDEVSLLGNQLHGKRLGKAWIKATEAVSGSHVLSATTTTPKIKRAWASVPQPRTLTGVDKEGNVFVAVFDGRSETSHGVSIKQAWDILRKRIGAKWALNLDGGGSSTLMFEGTLLNHPSDRYPRAVAVGWGAR